MDEIVYCADRGAWSRRKDEFAARKRLAKTPTNYRRPESDTTNPAPNTCEPILMVGGGQVWPLSSAREAWSSHDRVASKGHQEADTEPDGCQHAFTKQVR